MIQPEQVNRDESGFWTHSMFPDFGEHITREEWEKWCADNQIHGCFVYFEHDAPEELQDEWYEGEEYNCNAWHPTKPSDSSFLLSLHDTEDGPIAIFATPVQLNP